VNIFGGIDKAYIENPNDHWKILGHTIFSIQEQLREIRKELKKLMAINDDIKAAQTKETADISALQTAVTSLLTAFANETMTPADAQAVLDGINAQDTTVNSIATAVNNALNPPAPTP
jgi:hypothetical protein